MLTEMGWTHEFEHVTLEGISLDLERKGAIEVDGPPHYLQDVATGEDYERTTSSTDQHSSNHVFSGPPVGKSLTCRSSTELTRRGPSGASFSTII